MKKIISLTKAFYKNNKNDSGKMKAKTKVILYTLLGVYILFVFFNFWGMFISPLKEMGRTEVSISLMVTLISAFLFITSITYVANILYFSNDIENILPFPFKPKDIFTSKIFTIYIFEIIISVMFLLPGFISYGFYMNEGAIFYIYSSIVLLLLPIIPILIITVVYTIIMQFFKCAKYKNFFKVITTIFLLLIIIIFQVKLNSNMMDNGEYDSNYILSMCEEVNAKMPHYLKVAVNAIQNKDNFYGTISILSFIIINIISTIVVVYAFNKLYLRGVYFNLSGESSKILSKRKFNYVSRSIYNALIRKDMKCLFRNATFFIQCVLPIFFMPVAVLIIALTSNDELYNEVMFESENMKIVFGIVIIQFFMIVNYISVSAISRDGKDEATYMKTLPIKFEKQISAKTVAGILIGVLGLIVAVVFLYNIFHLNIFEVVTLLVIGILLNVVQSYLYVLIDLFHPKINWESEVAVVKQNMNIFYAILIGIGMMSVTIAFGNIFINYNIIYFIVSYIIFYLIIYGILKLYVKKNADKLYLKIM